MIAFDPGMEKERQVGNYGHLGSDFAKDQDSEWRCCHNSGWCRDLVHDLDLTILAPLMHRHDLYLYANHFLDPCFHDYRMVHSLKEQSLEAEAVLFEAEVVEVEGI